MPDEDEETGQGEAALQPCPQTAQAAKGQAGGQPGGEAPKSEEKKDEGVIDAEVVDEKK